MSVYWDMTGTLLLNLRRATPGSFVRWNADGNVYRIVWTRESDRRVRLEDQATGKRFTVRDDDLSEV